MKFTSEIVRNAAREIVGTRYTLKPENFTTVLNGKTYLICEPRGCEFYRADPIYYQSDIGNYRVFTCFYDARNNVNIEGDFMPGARYRNTSLRGDKPLKKPVLIDNMALHADVEYTGYAMSGGKPMFATWGIRDTEKRWGIPYGKFDFTKAGILGFANSVSDVHYDKVVIAKHPKVSDLGWRECDVLENLVGFDVVQDDDNYLVVRFWHENGEDFFDVEQNSMRVVG